MELIANNWDKIHTNSKIFLDKDTEFKTLGIEINNGINDVVYEKIILKKGYYFISGFWANMMGLSTDRTKAQNSGSDFLIVSESLKEFRK